jgi:hypothetical protein
VERPVAKTQFRCQNLRDGEVCHPTTPSNLFVRVVSTLAGTCIPLTAPTIKFLQSWSGSPSPVNMAVWGFGGALFLAAIFSVTYTLSHETDKGACFITALGIPGLCTALVNLASL